ncbi:MAG: hypothetical protein WAW96_08765 [Alphaproteobacteria bacterium]
MSDESHSSPVPALSAAPHIVSAIKDSALRHYLIGQLTGAMWQIESKSEEEQERRLQAALAALNALKPQDETEGMLGVQMIATHHAALDCLQRAIFELDGRDRSLTHASKFLRLYVEQLNALDRRRGLGKQQVNVGTVNVEPGAQAIVGNVSSRASP